MAAGVETLQETFKTKIVDELVKKRGVSDVIIARHVLEHAYDLQDYILAIKKMVRNGGYIVFEIPDCERAMLAGDCTILWEEHIHYFTMRSFRNLMHRSGLEIIFEDVAPYPLENSIILIAKKTEESANFIKDWSKEKRDFLNFKDLLQKRAQYVKLRLEELTHNGRIAIFGAGHLSIAFLCFNQVAQYVDVCFDDDKNKKGLHLPVGNIPILGSSELNATQYPTCLLGLNPQHHDKVRKKFESYLNQGGRMLSIFPQRDKKGLDAFMIQFEVKNEEVLYPKSEKVELNAKDIFQLKTLADLNERKRIRFCCHENERKTVHEMIIVHAKSCYVRPHLHKKRDESIYIIEGEVDLIIFDAHGNVAEVVEMGELSTSKVVYRKISKLTTHTLIFRSSHLVFKEVTQGPFDPKDTKFADWSPMESDHNDKKAAYICSLSKAITKRKF